MRRDALKAGRGPLFGDPDAALLCSRVPQLDEAGRGPLFGDPDAALLCSRVPQLDAHIRPVPPLGKPFLGPSATHTRYQVTPGTPPA
jgi:hypothetical protein